MPGVPRRLAVLRNLQTTLRGMTGAEYNYPLANPVAQVKMDPTINLLTGVGVPDVPFYNVEPTPDGGRTFWPEEQLTEEFIVNILGRHDADISVSPEIKTETWERMAADLELALETDTTRAGLAADTRLLVPQPFTAVGTGVVILVQPVRITIYRAYKDGT